MKFQTFLKTALLFPVLAALAAGCQTARPAAVAVPADSAITAAELAAVFGEAETGKSKLEIGEPRTAKPADPAVKTLTPDEALRVAAEKNPSFAEYAAAREAALAEVMAAAAWQNPSLEAGVGRGKTRGTPSTSGVEYSLGLIQPVEWPGKRGIRKEAAAAGVKVAELDEALFRSTLRADVLRAYWIAAGCENEAWFADEQSKLAAEALRIARMQASAGELDVIALLPVQREEQRLALEAAAAKTQVGEAAGVLRRLCGGGLPVGQTEVGGMCAAKAVGLDTARELALKKHPAILKLEAEKRRCELLVKQAESAKKPDLTPGLEVSRGVDVLSWGARLGMELPFWNWNKAGIAAAKAELHRVEAQLASKRLEVASGVEAAVAECRGAAVRAGRAMEFLDGTVQAEVVSKQAMAELGELSHAALVVAKQERFANLREVWRAMLAVQLARIQLEQAIGYGELK